MQKGFIKTFLDYFFLSKKKNEQSSCFCFFSDMEIKNDILESLSLEFL